MLIAFDIGGSRIRAARSPAPGRLDPLGEAAIPADTRAFLDALRRLVPSDARCLSVAVAGVVDPATGAITAANLPAVHGRPLAAEIEAALGLPVWIGNDADCFTLAEAREGVARGHRNVLGVILGSGVGGGLMIDGRLVVGAGGYAGEWGHGPVLDRERVPHFPCGCGRAGCVDTVGGARGLERLHRHLSGETLDSRAILGRWHAGEAAAGATLALWADLVSGPLAVVLNTVGVSAVPVGGGLSNDPALVATLDRAVRPRLLRATDRPLLVPARLPEPGLLGAALAGWSSLAHDP